jgi:hypothetical protein
LGSFPLLDKDVEKIFNYIDANQAKSILVSQDDPRRGEDKKMKFNNLIDINPHLSLLVPEIGDKDKEQIKERINVTILIVILTQNHTLLFSIFHASLIAKKQAYLFSGNICT